MSDLNPALDQPTHKPPSGDDDDDDDDDSSKIATWLPFALIIAFVTGFCIGICYVKLSKKLSRASAAAAAAPNARDADVALRDLPPPAYQAGNDNAERLEDGAGVAAERGVADHEQAVDEHGGNGAGNAPDTGTQTIVSRREGSRSTGAAPRTEHPGNVYVPPFFW